MVDQVKFKLAALGFAATISQILLLRELEVVFNGNELVLGVILAAWLVWTAAGAWGVPKWIKPGKKGLEIGLLSMGILLMGQVLVARGLRPWLGVAPGAEVELLPMVLGILLILAPLCLLGGWLFTCGARRLVEQGGSAGQAYAWEGAGAVIGGVLFSFWLVDWGNAFQTALVVIIFILAFLPDFRLLLPRSPFRQGNLVLLSLILLLILTFPLAKALQQMTLRWQWSDLVYTGDSPYGRITVQQRESQRIFYINGALAFETQGTFPEEVVHFPMLLHPAPRRVLLVGGGIAGDVEEILKHPVEGIIYVELDPLLIRAAGEYLPPEEAAFLQEPRVTLELTDGRVYIQQAAAGAFDAIIVDLPAPATGALNRYYTREFFSEARRLLKPGGILATGLPSAENYWSPELAQRNASLYRTLQAVFPQVLALPGEHTFFLASDTPLDSDPELLASRLLERQISTRWVTPEYIRYIMKGDRAQTIYQQLDSVAGVRLNRDLSPVCYYYDLTLWLGRLSLRLGKGFGELGSWNLSGWGILFVVVPLALGVGAARFRQAWRLPLVVAGTGLAQMLLQVVILFTFQVRHGSLYTGVALLVTAFMAGLAGGGALSNRWLVKGSWLRSPIQRPDVQPLLVKRALFILQIAITVFGALFILLLQLPLPGWSFSILAILGGGLAGMAFPLAVRLASGQNEHAAGKLYAADLLGGCLGALLTTTIFIPILGLPQTCAIVALLGVAGACMVWIWIN